MFSFMYVSSLSLKSPDRDKVIKLTITTITITLITIEF